MVTGLLACVGCSRRRSTMSVVAGEQATVFRCLRLAGRWSVWVDVVAFGAAGRVRSISVLQGRWSKLF